MNILFLHRKMLKRRRELKNCNILRTKQYFLMYFLTHIFFWYFLTINLMSEMYFLKINIIGTHKKCYYVHFYMFTLSTVLFVSSYFLDLLIDGTNWSAFLWKIILTHVIEINCYISWRMLLISFLMICFKR